MYQALLQRGKREQGQESYLGCVPSEKAIGVLQQKPLVVGERSERLPSAKHFS